MASMCIPKKHIVNIEHVEISANTDTDCILINSRLSDPFDDFIKFIIFDCIGRNHSAMVSKLIMH